MRHVLWLHAVLGLALVGCAPAGDEQGATAQAVGDGTALSLPVVIQVPLATGPTSAQSFTVDTTSNSIRVGCVRPHWLPTRADRAEVESQTDDLVGGVKIPVAKATVTAPDGGVKIVDVTALPAPTATQDNPDVDSGRDGYLDVYWDNQPAMSFKSKSPGTFRIAIDITTGFFSSINLGLCVM